MARVNVFAVCVLAVATSLAPAFAQITTPNAQVVAGIQQLSKSSQYAATLDLITANQVLLNEFSSSDLIAAAFSDPTGLQYVLATFGSPIYKSVLSNTTTSQELATSPAFVSALETPVADAASELGLLLQTAQQPATGKAAVDLQTLLTSLASIATAQGALVPVPAPAEKAPTPAPAPATLNLRTGTVTLAGR